MKLTLLVLDGVQALDVAGPLDVFTEANGFLPREQRYEITLVGGRPDSVICSSGMEFKVHCDYLNFHAERLSAQFPTAQVRPDKIYVRDGKLFTCGGVAAGIDLCLALVAEDWGHELAMKVAKRLIVYIRRDGGQSQYSPYLAVGPDADSLVARVLKYVSDHISEALSIEDIADAVGVSRRTFARAFARHAHVTPSVFVDQVRIDVARKLLEETDVPLKTVAFRCGFRNATQMRMVFARQLGATPRQYRERFRAGDLGRAA